MSRGRPGPRLVALLLVAALVVYMVVVGVRGVELMGDGRPAMVLLGLGVLALPLVGAWIVWQELRFGRRAQRLGSELDAAQNAPSGPPASPAPLPPPGPPAPPGQHAPPPQEGRETPLGRSRDRSVADAAFHRQRAAVEGAPDDWREWYRLAIAYGDAGDTARARRAMRHAIRLHDRGVVGG